MSTLKQSILSNVKNVRGWKTLRKIVVISVDDYGNIRLDGAKAREKMNKAGLRIFSRFDAYDALETREDLEMLYETLSSVKDKHGRNAVFTPFALTCNIDFEKMADENYEVYRYELLPSTFEKLTVDHYKAYIGTWNLWQEGIEKKLMVPQFHGREHFNLKVFEEKLKQRNTEVLTALKNRSYTSISSSGYPTINYTAAFDFWEIDENKRFTAIIKDGLKLFEQIYGYKSCHFNPPGGREHPIIHKVLYDSGIKYLDTPFIKNEHQGKGKFKKKINYTGKKNNLGMTYEVRNVVFEPTENRGIDWVNYSMKQIESAFFWNRPVIISSHRVNFCGHIDPNNRKQGLTGLKKLLKKIVQKWPEVEFMSTIELGDLISQNKY